MTSVQASPFIKWAGGKRKLLPLLHAAAPQQFTRLIEPFIGGGAYYFSADITGKDCLINDVNPELINTYKVVRDDVSALIGKLKAMSLDTSKDEFLRVRALDPWTDLAGDPVTRAARVIYLNKTCFNGLWRENAAGKFNVPWGQRLDVKLYDESNLRAASARLAGTFITNKGVGQLFNELIGEVGTPGTRGDALLRPGTLVYLDPPYIPLTPTASFSQYSKNGFDVYDQVALAETVKALHALGVSVMLSNSNTDLTRTIFSSLDLIPIKAPRSIAAAGGSRGSVGEVLGVSYARTSMNASSSFVGTNYANVATPLV